MARDKVRTRFLVFSALSVAIFAGALLGPFIVPNDPLKADFQMVNQPPSARFPFGTDKLGRCLFSRVVCGARVTIFSSLALVGVIFVFGTAVGVASSYAGGRFDTVCMRVTDIVLAFPDMVLAIAVAGFLGGGLTNAIITLACVSWTKYARLARSQVLALRDQAFIEAARLAGNTGPQIIFRHIMPNAMGPLIVTAALDIGVMMIGVAGLSFLGLGVRPPTPEWGAMLNEGRTYFQQYPGTIFFPGVAIFISIMVFNLFGDSLRDLLAPRQPGETAKEMP
ncbi:MAG: ABC transporter permease subunit [Deltaproteobacteria bacterium]|jgi:ABC-type dipeptide/oligopeptide/nickel transport system permease subunit|nr:ABC transporter permease subunit [Deltaproteobacteria bacterium]